MSEVLPIIEVVEYGETLRALHHDSHTTSGVWRWHVLDAATREVLRVKPEGFATAEEASADALDEYPGAEVITRALAP